MRTIFGIAIAVVLTLLNAAVAAATSVAPVLLGDQPDMQQVSVCENYSIPCDDSRAWDCARCIISSYSLSSADSGSGVTYVNEGGTTTGGGTNWYVDSDNPRPATPEEIDALMDELTTLMEINPVPSPERDRIAAAIFRDHHFPLAEAELLQGVVAASTIVNPEDVAAIQSAYEVMGLPDIAVDYGDWLNQNLPAYQIPVVDWYYDPNAIVRQRIADYGVDYFLGVGDMSNATRYEVWEENLQGQLDTSFLEGVVLIEMP